MRPKGQVLALVLLIACGLTACNRGRTAEAARENQPSATSASDQDFMMQAWQINSAEINAARAALQKSGNSDVKDYANMIQSDHNSALQDLNGMMKDKHVVQPEAIDAATQQNINRMNELTGAEFDREFINMMVSDHRKAIEIFRDQQSTAQNPDVKKYAENILPTLEMHLDKALQLQSKLFSARPEKKPAKSSP